MTDVPPETPVRIGARPDLDWGHGAFPRHRAPWARQAIIPAARP